MNSIPQSKSAFSAENLNLQESEYRGPLLIAEAELLAFQQHIQEKSRRKVRERLERERSR